MMKALLTRSLQAVKARVSARVIGADAAVSFAQEGEDRVLYRMFQGRFGRPGFYVDVGAHHPTRFSNTYLFYRMGWRGINLDAMPGSMAAFARARPRDINWRSRSRGAGARSRIIRSTNRRSTPSRLRSRSRI